MVMGFKEELKANNELFKQRMKANNEQFKKDIKNINKSKGSEGGPAPKNSNHSDRWRNVPSWQIITLLIVFFPVGLYLLWRQDRWSKRRKNISTWGFGTALVAFFALVIIFAPPSVTLTSALSPVNADTYHLTGSVTPPGSQISVNGVPAKVTGDTFSEDVQLQEGDNDLRVVVTSGNKHSEQVFKIHRYTKTEVAAQEKAAADKKAAADAAKAKADAASAKKKADAEAAAKAKQQQATAKPAAPAHPAPTPSAATTARPPAAPAVTVSQKNAVSKAKSYLNYTAFSHDGLVDQLVYEQFSLADATYGADHAGADWNAQAAKKARDYMSYSSFSRGGLIDQLEYEKFTPDQAAYGANSVGL